MDLIERYLGAVRWNLPADKADDIVAELADLIAARIEDREGALDRSLTRGEISALLKEFGHPLAVAGQYHGQRSLIGAEVFPFYWFVLRIVLVVIAAIEAVQIGGGIVVGQHFMQALIQGGGNLIHSLIYNAALVTIGFAVIERTRWLDEYLAKWKPEELPDLSKLRLDLPPRKRWEPVIQIAFCLAFLAWWAGALPILLVPHDAKIDVVGAPVWTALYWPVIALVSARLLLSLVAMLRPAWKPLRAALILGCTAGTLLIAKVLHEATRIVIVTGSDPDKVAQVQQGLDKGLQIVVIAVAALSAIECAKELWQLYRER
ncbi:hypothetical protein AB2M62_17130 [Sphingomonas sp. MMS12-HWE2-04]|uniref:hypothetical protein n=1 Tax=Sphingomonas sp. MMS12-HWE2-04 TaxID=3234199 RepID=UPI00384CF52D